MPTTKYRLSIPLDPESLAVYQRMADVLGKSLGATISEWLYETREGAGVATMAMERAKQSPARAIRELQAIAEATQESLLAADRELARMGRVGSTDSQDRPADGTVRSAATAVGRKRRAA